jgi:predicted RNase H-like HicB family nuclease
MRHREILTTRHYRYTALFEPEEGGYVVTFPSLPGLMTEGETLEEARNRAAEAIRSYLENLSEDGRSIPPEIAEVLEVAVEER